MTTKKQKQPSDSTSKKQSNIGKIPKKTQRDHMKLNLAHALIIHGMTMELYSNTKDKPFKNLLLDIIYVHELIIDESDNEQIKEELNYKPLKTSKNETQKEQSSETINS